MWCIVNKSPCIYIQNQTSKYYQYIWPIIQIAAKCKVDLSLILIPLWLLIGDVLEIVISQRMSLKIRNSVLGPFFRGLNLVIIYTDLKIWMRVIVVLLIWGCFPLKWAQNINPHFLRHPVYLLFLDIRLILQVVSCPAWFNQTRSNLKLQVWLCPWTFQSWPSILEISVTKL